MKTIDINIKNRQNPAPRTVVYAVDGLTEWVALIAVGRARIRIPFTGGSISGYGCVPARFATSSEALVKLIEDSLHFKSGRIRRDS